MNQDLLEIKCLSCVKIIFLLTFIHVEKFIIKIKGKALSVTGREGP